MTEPYALPDGVSVDEATETLLRQGIGDGLPVVPPTRRRWDAMLAGVADPDAVLGLVPPLFGELTASAAAYHCVLAGCRPGDLPVVLAAVRACLEPDFNLLGVATTTGTATVAVLVGGPAVRELGLNHGTNLLGPGNRANAVIGRGVALTLAGVGGVQPGVTTMATTGQPGRYTFCLAEDPDAPYPPVAVRAGIPESAVTVLSAGGTAEVIPRQDRGSPDDILDPLADALAGAALAAGDPARMAGCEQSVIIPPELAGRLAGELPRVELVQRELYARGNAVLRARTGDPEARVSADAAALTPIVAGGTGIKMLHIPGWMGGSRSATQPVKPDETCTIR